MEKLKFTQWQFLITVTNIKPIYRVVYADSKGRYYIKNDGILVDVTEMKSKFIPR